MARKKTWGNVSVRTKSDAAGGYVSIRATDLTSGAQVCVMLYGTGRVGVRFEDRPNVTVGQDGRVVG